MKKIFISSSFLFISAFAFGQSVLIEPGTTSKRFVVKSTGSNYGHFSTTNSVGADLFFKRSAIGDGTTGTEVGIISTFLDRFYIGGTLTNGLSFGANDTEKMRITSTGLVGIGTVSPNYNLHLHNSNTGTSSILQLTNETIGSTATDGLYIGINNSGNASIFNQEGGSLRLGTNGSGFLALQNEKACLSCVLPAGKFDIYHNTAGSPTNPHITLKTTVNASNGMIRMENLDGSKYFGQYFNVNSATPANNFVSFDYNGNTPILDMQGNGNVKVSGFTTLGNDPTAPRIKMKTLTSTTGATQGAANSPIMIHGVTASKIISVSVFVDFGSNFFIPPGFVASAGQQYDYQITVSTIETFNHPTNSGNILSKPIKVVITYIE